MFKKKKKPLSSFLSLNVLISKRWHFYWLIFLSHRLGLPHSSVGKESACSAREGLIPGWERSSGEVQSCFVLTLPFLYISRARRKGRGEETQREGVYFQLPFITSERKEMATHSSILAWDIPWTEEPGGLQSMELPRVRHDCTTNTLLHSQVYREIEVG